MSDPVNICVCGGRGVDDAEYVFDCLDAVKHLYWNKEVILHTGACKGADELAERYAEEQGWQIESHPPDYKAFKGREKYAPLARNEEMGEVCDVVVAFWNHHSRGTRHMIGVGMKQKAEIHIFPVDYESA